MKAYEQRNRAQAETGPRPRRGNTSGIRRKAGRASAHADKLGKRPSDTKRPRPGSAQRKAGRHPEGKEVKWRGDKRGPRHADLPRVPFTRRREPGNYGQWLHYRIVPGLRRIQYVESRSGKNVCFMVSYSKNRMLWKQSKLQGFKNPLELLIDILRKRVAAFLAEEGRAAA
jgi:hypothetical protein